MGVAEFADVALPVAVHGTFVYAIGRGDPDIERAPILPDGSLGGRYDKVRLVPIATERRRRWWLPSGPRSKNWTRPTCWFMWSICPIRGRMLAWASSPTCSVSSG